LSSLNVFAIILYNHYTIGRCGVHGQRSMDPAAASAPEHGYRLALGARHPAALS